MKRLRKIILRTIIVLVSLAGLISLLGYLYEDKVKTFLITSINKQLNSKLETSSIDFSVWKRFPSASVTFSDVKLLGAFPEGYSDDPDTLLQAGELYFAISLFDIIAGNLSVNSILMEEGKVKLIYNNDGEGNYHVFTGESGEEDDSGFDLKEVLLSNVNFEYLDSKSGDKIICNIRKAEASGELQQSDFTLYAGIDGTAQVLDLSGLSYPLSGKDFRLHGDMHIRGNEKSLTCNEVEMQVAGMNFAVSGNTGWDEIKTVDLQVNGKDLDIRSFLSLLPDQYQELLALYSSEGNFYFNAGIKSEANSSSPGVNIQFGVSDGQVSYDGGNPLKNFNASGIFSGGGNAGIEGMKLELREFSGSMSKSTFTGDGTLSNFKNPNLNIHLAGDLFLEEIMALFPSDSLPVLKGLARIDANFAGAVKKEGEFTVEDFTRSKTSGEILLEEIFVTPLTGNAFTALNGRMLFDNNDIIVSELKGNIGASDFALKGFFRNIISWFFIPDNKLVVDADFKSDKFDLSELVLQGDQKDETTNFNLEFSRKAHLYLKVDVGDIKYQHFNGNDLRGRIVLKDGYFTADNLSLNAFSGNLALKGKIDATDLNDIFIRCEMKAESVELPELFAATGNFGQELLQSKHIKGKASIDLDFTASTDTTLNLKEDEIFATAVISVVNGELLDFEPMNALSRFVEVEELKHIRFGLLENEIHVRDRKIFIPSMHISSNALSLDVSGTHSFDNVIDYRFKIMMSELLASKARKARKQNDEFGIYEVEEGRRRMALFLAMKGTVDDPRFMYDRVGLTTKIKDDIKNEKKTVKSLLNKEFGMFEKDSTLTEQQKAAPVEFEIEWEDSDKEEQKKESEGRFEKKRESKFKKWIKNLPGEEVAPEYE